MRVSFEEAKRITAEVIARSEGNIVPWTKLPLDNVVFDKLGAIPLLEMLINLNVVTKEHVDGKTYPKEKFQMVMRIIGGKLLMRGKDLVERPDAYAWTIEKVAKAKNKRHLGFHSTEGALTYAELLSKIESEHERELFTDLLVNWSKDLVLIHTDEERRMVIVITKELAEAFKELPNSYDIEWPTEGADGVELTPVREGDALVIEHCSFGEAFYVVQKDEFELTHVIGHI